MTIILSDNTKGRPNHNHDRFEFISRGPILHFWGTPGWRPGWPFYTVEHRETTKIFHQMCHQSHFGVASDAKLFWKIMVVVVFGPSLK